MAGDLRAIITALQDGRPRSNDPPIWWSTSARPPAGSTATSSNPKLRGLIGKMGEQAQQLFTAAMEAYVENDAAKAAAIDDMDSYLDDAAEAVRPGDLREPRRRAHRPPGRRAAGRGRSLLRADRRPRGEHRREGPLHGHRLAARSMPAPPGSGPAADTGLGHRGTGTPSRRYGSTCPGSITRPRAADAARRWTSLLSPARRQEGHGRPDAASSPNRRILHRRRTRGAELERLASGARRLADRRRPRRARTVR